MLSGWMVQVLWLIQSMQYKLAKSELSYILFLWITCGKVATEEQFFVLEFPLLLEGFFMSKKLSRQNICNSRDFPYTLLWEKAVKLFLAYSLKMAFEQWNLFWGYAHNSTWSSSPLFCAVFVLTFPQYAEHLIHKDSQKDQEQSYILETKLFGSFHVHHSWCWIPRNHQSFERWHHKFETMRMTIFSERNCR